MNKLTLRMRITVLVGIIIATIAVLLTAASISGANHYFVGKEPLHKTVIVGPEIGQHPNKSTLGNDVADRNNSSVLAELKVSAAQRNFSAQSILVMLCIGIVGIGAAYVIVGRALKPLTQLSDTLQDIHARNLSKRIHVPDAKDEVGSLSTSFNSMLDRLDGAFTRQKRFAANAAHELKTPLATMKASLQVLHFDENPSTDDYRANAKTIQQSTERLIKVVDDLLQLASEDHADLRDDISLQAVFEEVSRELEPVAEEKQVRIVVHANNCRLQGNKTLLYRAIVNLTANAVKYNLQGGWVELAAREKNGFVEITVRDNGIGIAAEEIGKIFEPFYRVNQSRSPAMAGSGLGLSLVKTIIDKHGGTIDVTSIKGKETTIQVRIPSRCE